MFSLEQGKKLIHAARKAVIFKFEGKSFELKEFEEPSGVFVTIYSYPDKRLKGCIGFPEPMFPLNSALARAAVSAAFSDPRFRPLQNEELDKVIFEISLLTNPELVSAKKPEDYMQEIKVGRDGLVAEQNRHRGLLLPQVAVEWNWNVEEFLNNTCEKAGLPLESWKDTKLVKIYKFQAQIFREVTPNGRVESKDF